MVVTGGLGFIGSSTAARLLDLGAHVTVIDSLHPQGGSDRRNLPPRHERLKILEADINDVSAYSSALEGVDVVVHAAAFTSHPEAARRPEEAIRCNVLGTQALVAAIAASGSSPVLVNVGTSSQFGAATSGVLRATDPENPRDVYSATKSAGEKLVHVANAIQGLQTRRLRLANVYGPRARHDSPSMGFLNFFIGQAARNETLTVYGDGQQAREITYIDDAVQAILHSCDRTLGPDALFLVASGERRSVADLANTICAETGRGRVDFVPWPAERQAMEVGDVRLDSQQFRDATGWTPRVRFAQGVRYTTDAFRRRMELTQELRD